jgi:hypothetical protein
LTIQLNDKAIVSLSVPAPSLFGTWLVAAGHFRITVGTASSPTGTAGSLSVPAPSLFGTWLVAAGHFRITVGTASSPTGTAGSLFIPAAGLTGTSVSLSVTDATLSETALN